MVFESDRPIFIIGCPRSGTTLLQLMLHSHPRIAVAPETRFVIPAYFHRKVYGDMREPENRRRLAQWIATGKGTKFHELGLDRDEFVTAAVHAPGSLGSVIGTAFAEYARRFGKPRWGDKRPSYFQHVGTLRRMFPDAQFIHLIRDGRDCVASLKEMPWYRGNVYTAVANWADAIDFGRRHAAELPKDAYFELRYEDLTADPEGALRALCTFLGEEYDPAMRDQREVASQAVPPHKVWHRNTHREVNRSRVGSWANRLEPWEVSLCETVLGERLTALGYELSGAPRASREHVSKYRAAAWRRRRARWKREARDRVSRLREPGPVAAMLTRYQRLHCVPA
nr:MAG: sulfotransferase [Actinomycetota bacterium]